jgi:hypothetical protein
LHIGSFILQQHDRLLPNGGLYVCENYALKEERQDLLLCRTCRRNQRKWNGKTSPNSVLWWCNKEMAEKLKIVFSKDFDASTKPNNIECSFAISQ